MNSPTHSRGVLPTAARLLTFRLTTDCPVSHILNERVFRLERPHAEPGPVARHDGALLEAEPREGVVSVQQVPVELNQSVLEIKTMLGRLVGEDVELFIDLDPRVGVHAFAGAILRPWRPRWASLFLEAGYRYVEIERRKNDAALSGLTLSLGLRAER